jgi:Protein of unknown function (DUF2505)
MRFQAEHRFHGSPDAVAALLADPEFYVALDLPDVSKPEVLEERTEGDRSVVRLRYEFVGSLDPVAHRVLGQRRLVWIQEIDIDRSTTSGTLSFEAEADPKRLHGSADFTLVAEGEGSSRQLSGEVVVAVPLIGSWAERQILPGLLRRLDIEAESLDARLQAPP